MLDRIEQIDPQLTPEQRLEALKIAHETKDPAVKAAALLLLNPPYLVVRGSGEVPADGSLRWFLKDEDIAALRSMVGSPGL